MNHARILALACASCLSTPALAQETPSAMPEMDHSQMDHSQMDQGGETAAICTTPYRPHPYADGSGTSRLPGFEGTGGSGCSESSAHTAGVHLVHNADAMVMVHGFVSAQYTDHSGPRGDDKLYSTSMLMLMGEHRTGWGKVQLKSMLSLEPLMDAEGYPNLFATGETAGGEPLVDRQHPHDLFMELAARVDVDVAPGTSLFLYGGPVGEPALGPSAFMHRGSAANNPEPPITHHWFDSTHITYGVVTAGVASSRFQLEASAFRGAEPDEERWAIETPRLDSWSARASWNPSPNWSLQASYGQIKQPEATHPGEDENRFTASAHFTNWGGVSAMAAFSAKDRVPGDTLTAWLGELNWDLDAHNSLFGRVENVANDELFHDHDDPLHERTFRVTKLQAGYARHVALADLLKLSFGASLAGYVRPDLLAPAYGSPFGYTLFARLSLTP